MTRALPTMVGITALIGPVAAGILTMISYPARPDSMIVLGLVASSACLALLNVTLVFRRFDIEWREFAQYYSTAVVAYLLRVVLIGYALYASGAGDAAHLFYLALLLYAFEVPILIGFTVAVRDSVAHSIPD